MCPEIFKTLMKLVKKNAEDRVNEAALEDAGEHGDEE